MAITIANETKSEYSKHATTAPNIGNINTSNPHYDIFIRNPDQRPGLQLQGYREYTPKGSFMGKFAECKGTSWVKFRRQQRSPMHA